MSETILGGKTYHTAVYYALQSEVLQRFSDRVLPLVRMNNKPIEKLPLEITGVAYGLINNIPVLYIEVHAYGKPNDDDNTKVVIVYNPGNLLDYLTDDAVTYKGEVYYAGNNFWRLCAEGERPW